MKQALLTVSLVTLIACSASSPGSPTGGAGGPADWAPSASYDDTDGKSHRFQFGGALVDAAGAIAFDAHGRVVLAGRADAAIGFGSGLVAPVEQGNLFLAVLDKEGAHPLARRYAVSVESVSNVVVDAEGGFLVGGTAHSAAGSGPLSFTSTVQSPVPTAAFVAKLDPSGEPLWSQTFGPALGMGVAEDAEGNVLSVLQFDRELVVVKLDKAGSTIFSLSPGPLQLPSSSPSVTSMVLDAHGDMLLTGENFGTFTVDSSPSGVGAAFAAKISGKDGSLLWATPLPANAHSGSGEAIVVDASGDAFVAGLISLKLYEKRLSGVDGSVLWSKDSADGCTSVALALAPDGAVKLLATAYAGSTFDSAPLMQGGSYFATINPTNGLLHDANPVSELGEESDPADSVGAHPHLVIGPKSEVAITDALWGTRKTSDVDLTSEGWNDILLVTLPPR